MTVTEVKATNHLKNKLEHAGASHEGPTVACTNIIVVTCATDNIRSIPWIMHVNISQHTAQD